MNSKLPKLSNLINLQTKLANLIEDCYFLEKHFKHAVKCVKKGDKETAKYHLTHSMQQHYKSAVNCCSEIEELLDLIKKEIKNTEKN